MSPKILPTVAPHLRSLFDLLTSGSSLLATEDFEDCRDDCRGLPRLRLEAFITGGEGVVLESVC